MVEQHAFPEEDQAAGENTTRVYLDHAAATPVHPDVLAAMTPYFSEIYGNPGAIHTEGRTAYQAVSDARASVARVLGVRPGGVTFTSGGTESNNMAILGYLRTLQAAGRAYEDMEICTTAIEHPATSEALAEAARWGVSVRYLPLDEAGKCCVSDVAEYLSDRTVLVSVAHVNSEIGVIQPTAAIARVLQRCNTVREQTDPIRLHVDAAQSPLWLPCRLDQLGADMISLDAGKCCGPKGVGLVVTARPQLLHAGVLFGGGQESGLRPGTEPVPLIVGAAAALECAQAGYASRATATAAVRDAGLAYLAEHVPVSIINGPRGTDRVANNINLSLPGYDTEFAATVLDAHGFAVSTKSACSSNDSAASHVVAAITGDRSRARATLRVTLGADTTEADLLRCIDCLREHVAHMEPFRTLPEDMQG